MTAADDADRRVGHALVTGEYPLTTAELAAVLAAATWRPPTDDAAGALVARCWRELARIDLPLAQQAAVAALVDGAPWGSYERATDVISTPYTESIP